MKWPRLFGLSSYAAILVLALAAPALGTVVQAHLTDPGWNAQDATQCLQAAIDTGADTVVVADMGAEWMVRPIFATHNDQTLIFADGVVLYAIEGAFKGRNDCLLTISGRSNITVLGYGATLRMRKRDYQDDSRYDKSEWRHAFSISGGHNISVFGLRLEASGGDGVFVGGGNPSHNILLSDLISDDNHRQGISITNVRRMVVRNSVFMNTWGTLPQCGIDIEPDHPEHVIDDLQLVNCAFLNNRRFGFKIALWHVDESTEDISIAARWVYSEAGVDPLANHEHSPLDIGFNPEYAPRADIVFEQCDFVGPPEGGDVRTSQLRNLHADRQRLRFTASQWRGSQRPPIMFVNGGNIDCGGVVWEECSVNLDADEPFLRFLNRVGSIGPLSGAVAVHSPFAARMDIGSLGRDISLEVDSVPTRPPQVAIESPAPVARFRAGATATIAATAWDPDAGQEDGAGIDRVEFEVRQGEQVVAVATDAQAPFSYTLDTAELSRGVYMVRAKALSAEYGSHATALVPVQVTGTAAVMTGAPAPASMPYPLDGAQDSRRDTRLVWTAEAESYEVYLGNSSSLNTGDLVGRTGAKALAVGDLVEGRRYYWRVDAVNAQGTTPGPVWTFTTGTFTRAVAHYTFEEGEGGDIADVSGNGHRGRIVGHVAWGPGKIGGGLVFDGSASWVDLGRRLAEIGTYSGPQGASSVAAWIKPVIGDDFMWIITGLGGLHYIGLSAQEGLGRIHCQVKDSANNVNYWPRSERVMESGEWVHIAVVFEGGKGYRVYLNGQLNNWEENADLSLYQYSSEPAFLAKDTWSETNYYKGGLDEMWVFSYALTDSEVMALYVEGVGTAVTEEAEAEATTFTLEANYPNPFNPRTVIRFAVPAAEPVELAIFDISGQKVFTLVDEVLVAGQYQRQLDASQLGSGVFFYRLRTPTQEQTRKMLLLQ